jgi:hypothetical protein
MRIDHPDDHPDDPSGSVGSRLNRQRTQREQANPTSAVWFDAEHLARNRKVVGSNPTFVPEETLFRVCTDARSIDRGD